MQNMQEVWNRIQQHKHKQKEITSMYKDALDSAPDYRQITEKIKELAQRKKQLEQQAKNDMAGDFEKLIAVKKELQLDKEMLADLAISSLMKGETVSITDSEKNEYEPVYSVRFRKANTVRKED
ncbi:MAG TPA: hypothetical protein VHA30_00225 [Patescibacteria group bacterium]|nr:hypothetical protein [Patescibacteria group bacterium]